MAGTSTTNVTSKPIPFSCHCGDISVTVPRKPDHINQCQCSLCRRYGVGWGYYQTDEAEIKKKPGAKTNTYVWGDKTVEFHFCASCGCIVYYWPLSDGGAAKLGLNVQCVDNIEDLKWVEKRITYEDALTVLDGVYNDKGRIEQT